MIRRANVLVCAVFFGIAALTATVNVLTKTASAATSTLKVSPVRTDIEILPGVTKTVKTTVTNLTDAAITVRPIENDFVAGDERGTPALILDGNRFAPAHSLKRFMKPLPDITIQPGEAKTVIVVIRVPSDTSAGGYFGAVRFAPVSATEGGQVNVSPSAASLILLKVPGDAPEKLALTDFSLQQSGKEGAFFSNSDGLQLTARFQNQGNTQLGPFGKVSVKKGDDVVYEADFNAKDPHDMILPGSARRWDIPLGGIEGFGQYTVSAVFTYGQKNQTIDVSKSFWLVPSWMIVVGVLGAVVVVGLIVGVLLLRRRKRRALRSHHRR